MSMNIEIDAAWQIFEKSVSESIRLIKDEYFHVVRYIDDLDIEKVYRERVYCYELYHQLRLQLGDQFEYVLHGELDKVGHEEICKIFVTDKRECPRPCPDFLLHIPGEQSGSSNIAIMEVKRSDTSKSGINSDLEKIDTFMDKAKYQHGIFLFFGDTEPDIAPNSCKQNLNILWHEKVGYPPKHLARDGKWYN